MPWIGPWALLHGSRNVCALRSMLYALRVCALRPSLPTQNCRYEVWIRAMPTAESLRLKEDAARELNWKRWGPYLSERQWGTVREDYSATGEVWDSFTHDMARSRTYRWGEDGLLGVTDRECRLCFALALWNGRD